MNPHKLKPHPHRLKLRESPQVETQRIPHKVKLCGGLGWFLLGLHLGDFVVEDLLNQLEVVLVDDREVLGDIDIGNIVAAHVVEGFIDITLAELHHVSRQGGERMAGLVVIQPEISGRQMKAVRDIKR